MCKWPECSWNIELWKLKTQISLYICQYLELSGILHLSLIIFFLVYLSVVLSCTHKISLMSV